MASENRKKRILDLLDERSSITVAELSKILSISEVSVRKLLNDMEKDGQLKRTWGGAFCTSGSLQELSHKEKEPKNLEEKISIAKEAYACIDDGDAVFLDCGTTTHQLARLIKNGPKRNLMVGTNAINIAQELAEAEDIHVILIGGEFRHRILSCVGCLAEDTLKSMFFDKGFITGNHVSLENGFTTPNLQEAKIKNIMMKSSKEHYILVDYSKFGNDSLALIAGIPEIQCIISDWNAPEDMVRKFRDLGIKVIVGSK